MLPMVAVVMLNVAEVADAVTMADAGTVRVELVFDRVMPAPPAGAAWDRVTVQIPEEFAARVVGVQDSEDTAAGATKVTVTLPALPL